MRKIIYIDLDNTLADYVGMAKKMEITLEDAKHTEGFFRRLKPMPYATTSPRLVIEEERTETNRFSLVAFGVRLFVRSKAS